MRPSVLGGGRGVSGGVATRRIRRALVITEFASAITLLAGAGLLIRSLWSAENVDPGFRPEAVLSMQLSSPALMTAAQEVDLYSRVLEQIESLSGVKSAGIIGNFFIGGNPEQTLTTEGDSGTISVRLRFRREEVGGRFFEAVGTPLLKGRFFLVTDGPDPPRVAILNNGMARRLWPGRDPLGRRFKLGTGFSAIALLMAAISIYGLIQYSVATRTQEIGVRIAVGAQAGQILRMMIGEGLKLSLIGLAIGLVGTLGLGRIGSSLLFGVSATDPLTFVAVSLLLTAAAAAASFFPARRAMKIEPVAALRQE